MHAIVVYESMYGNTRAVAEAIAEGLGGVPVEPVYKAAVADADLLVVGGPTHMHSLSTAHSRLLAVEAVHEDGEIHLEPGAADPPGLREWLRDLPDNDRTLAAAFDTRLDKAPWLTGVAARGIARRLSRRGYKVLDTASFLVEDSEGPLEEGELDCARGWGEELARVSQSPRARALPAQPLG